MLKAIESADYKECIVCPHCYMYLDKSMVGRNYQVKYMTTPGQPYSENKVAYMECPNCNMDFSLGNITIPFWFG